MLGRLGSTFGRRLPVTGRRWFSEGPGLVSDGAMDPGLSAFSKAALGLSTIGVLGFFAFDSGSDFSISHKWLKTLDEKFENLVEWAVPEKPGPWLLDLETMKYPEYIPTLVMDMDKVLVHMEHDSMQGWRVVRRPGADQFLGELQHYYELVVFSDDVFPVAIDVVSKWNIPCTGVLHREFCKKTHDGYVKNIGKLGRRLDKVILLDHERVAGRDYPENLVLVKPFEGDETDRQLMDLLEFLKAAATSQEDVRKFIAKFGGGDHDIGRRYLLKKKEVDAKVQQRRAFGRAFVGAAAPPMLPKQAGL
jgi:hypothetical protein